MLDRFDFILRMRLRGPAAGVGIAFAAVLVVALGLFFLFGNSRVPRILYFPAAGGSRTLAELRMVPRHAGLEAGVAETADSVLLGPTRPDAQRLFARGATVTAVMLSGHTVYVDLTPQVLEDDPEVPLSTEAALDVLTRCLRKNFPRFTRVVYLIDGQVPRFAEKKKI
ncbi:MAG TPA: hypothetical protein VFI08_10860 [Spirochaetia bacterium]|nr:hypothetical protein [Spirochaetia bacterium]